MVTMTEQEDIGVITSANALELVFDTSSDVDIPVFQQVFQTEEYHLPVNPVISHTGGTAVFASTAFYKLHGILDNIFHIIINLFRESKSTHILVVKICRLRAQSFILAMSM